MKLSIVSGNPTKPSSAMHVLLDHPMELAALIALRPSEMVLSLSCAVLSEVLSCPWHDVGEELHFDAAKWFAAQGHVEEGDWIRFGSGHLDLDRMSSCCSSDSQAPLELARLGSYGGMHSASAAKFKSICSTQPVIT
jgi:hypothetical protein